MLTLRSPGRSRTGAVYRLELAGTLKRPLFGSLVVILFVESWLLSTGKYFISSGDASVGGTKVWLTSEFSFAHLLGYLIVLLYGFFASIAAGTAVTGDDEQKVGEILHATPLRPGEYVWGKFLAVATGLLAALGFHVLFAVFFNHVAPNAGTAEMRGPFALINYLRPVLVFGLPTLLFLLGVSWYLGERWRRPVTVFLFPIAVLAVSLFFFWTWAPTWLDPRLNRALMLADPTGFRWLNETWLKLDRGAGFYNTARIGLDLPFVLSRIAFAAAGLAAVGLSQRHLARHLRRPGEDRKRGREPSTAEAVPATALAPADRLASLGMRRRPVGFLRGLRITAGTELRSLLASPGLYVFCGLILLQIVGTSLVRTGYLGAPLLLTPGRLAVEAMAQLSFYLCMFLMFYTIESLERERRTGFASLAYSAPLPTSAMLFGKAAANLAVGLSMVLATFLAYAAALLVQGTVPLDPRPFLLVWGLLLVPTLLVWTSFVTAVQAVSGQRFLSYGVCLGTLALTGYLTLGDKMTWVGNWMLWGALKWSDLSVFEMDRRALVLNRLLALALAALFMAVATRSFRRRQTDAAGVFHRLSPGRIGRRLLHLSPLLALPLLFGTLLFLTVRNGFQGAATQKQVFEYWKQNLATWLEAPQPSLAGVDLDLRIEPERRWLHQRGTYELVNDRDAPLARFALSGRRFWKNVRWTLDGKPWQPEDRSTLWVFTPPAPLPPGGRVRVGFDFEQIYPEGVSWNGGDHDEFILPSAVVLTSFTPSFAPVIGYREGIGVEAGKNDYEAKDFLPDFWQGKTRAGLGASSPYSFRIRITGPADFIWNSVGTRVAESVSAGERTVVWQSDRPVRFFNVVGGRWKVKTGQGTAIYYDASHAWNVPAMSATLDASRRWFSEWFHPYPWRELKLSEFPGLAHYAQGFPTNITFSEDIGFLVKSDLDTKSDLVFLITAHEAAHQWWGNLLAPGEGPGGVVLAEGTSNFSALLLMEQVRGKPARRELARRLEEQYGDRRFADAERPLAWVDNSRQGDETVIYDKGAWAFWMLLRHMGRERMLAGLRQLFTDWSDRSDHPVIQDFTAAMRPFAADPAAYDAFMQQWFFDVVVPEYHLAGARKARAGTGWEVTVKVRNAGTGRMPIEVAAVRGDQDNLDVRRTVVLGPGEEREVRIACSFEPDRVVVDPDVQVLQLRRKAAVSSL